MPDRAPAARGALVIVSPGSEPRLLRAHEDGIRAAGRFRRQNSFGVDAGADVVQFFPASQSCRAPKNRGPLHSGVLPTAAVH